MKPGEVSRKDKIREALKKAGKALTLTEISKLTHFSSKKINQSLNTFEFSVVRVGLQIYDLPSHFYVGRSFRCTPSVIEAEKGVVRADEELPLFLTVKFGYSDPIILVDENNKQYLVRIVKCSKISPFQYYVGLKKWFHQQNFQFGDDIIFTCLSFDDRKYLIRRVRKTERNEKLISLKNKLLADCVYKILSMTTYKYEEVVYLFRKYVFIYPFNDDTPPDSVFKALLSDRRFIASTSESILDGRSLSADRKVICLSKYYYQDKNNCYVLVEILSDEFGKFGICSLCDERMIWKPVTGWRHCKNDMEGVDTDIPKEFFKIDKLNNVKN